VFSAAVHGRELTTGTGWPALARTARALVRACLQPFGYLAFVVALGALSSAARLLGDEHELGFFAGRLSDMIWRYPEITRRGVQMAWLAWAVLLAVAVSPADPITSRWDEALLLVLAACVIWRRSRAGHQAGH
jgi:hypothetical protein